MNVCGRKVTHTVRVVGKQRVGFVCLLHLDRTKNVALAEGAQLHIENYYGDEMLCQLPSSEPNQKENL